MKHGFYLTRKRFLFVLITSLLVGFILLCRWQQGIAEWYMKNVYPVIATILSYISSIFPFSLFDVFLTLGILTLLASIIAIILRKVKFKKWLYVFLGCLVGIIIWFYLSWGIAYFRDDFYKRTGIQKADFDSANFKKFLNDYINELNTAYIPIKTLDYKQVDNEIEESYKRWHHDLRLPYPCGKRPVKRMIYEKWITMSGVSGYFGPFFNEVHVNRHAMPFEQPSIIAHEKAHQFGIASEAECNLYAYIICTTSDYQPVKYSGYFEALGYVLNNARKLLPNEYEDFRKQIKPEILEDYKTSYQNWQQGINKTLSEAQSKVYDAYLKTNKITSGITNYSEMVALLISWHNRK